MHLGKVCNAVVHLFLVQYLQLLVRRRLVHRQILAVTTLPPVPVAYTTPGSVTMWWTARMAPTSEAALLARVWQPSSHATPAAALSGVMPAMATMTVGTTLTKHSAGPLPPVQVSTVWFDG